MRSLKVIVLDSCRPSHLYPDSFSGSIHVLGHPARAIATLQRRQFTHSWWLEDQHRSSARTCSSQPLILSRSSRRIRYDLTWKNLGDREDVQPQPCTRYGYTGQASAPPNQPCEMPKKASFTLGETPPFSSPVHQPVNAPISTVLLWQCTPEARHPALSSASVPAEDVRHTTPCHWQILPQRYLDAGLDEACHRSLPGYLCIRRSLPIVAMEDRGCCCRPSRTPEASGVRECISSRSRTLLYDLLFRKCKRWFTLPFLGE